MLESLHALQMCCPRLWSHRLAPLHSLHFCTLDACVRRSSPPQSRHAARRQLCKQMLALPHHRQTLFLRLNGHMLEPHALLTVAPLLIARAQARARFHCARSMLCAHSTGLVANELLPRSAPSKAAAVTEGRAADRPADNVALPAAAASPAPWQCSAAGEDGCGGRGSPSAGLAACCALASMAPGARSASARPRSLPALVSPLSLERGMGRRRRGGGECRGTGQDSCKDREARTKTLRRQL